MITTLLSLAFHIHKSTVMKVMSALAFSSGNLEVFIAAQTQAKTPKPISTERPSFLCQFNCRFHMILMGRIARDRSMNANQPITAISAWIKRRDKSVPNVLPVNKEKSVCLCDGQHTALPAGTKAGFHSLGNVRYLTACTKILDLRFDWPTLYEGENNSYAAEQSTADHDGPYQKRPSPYALTHDTHNQECNRNLASC